MTTIEFSRIINEALGLAKCQHKFDVLKASAVHNDADNLREMSVVGTFGPLGTREVQFHICGHNICITHMHYVVAPSLGRWALINECFNIAEPGSLQQLGDAICRLLKTNVEDIQTGILNAEL